MKTTVKLESQKPLVLMPLKDYEGIMETLDILSSNPNITAELEKEKKEILKGNFISYKNLKEKYRRKT